MDAANGVGLAANQIGVAKRLFVYDCAPTRGHDRRVAAGSSSTPCWRPPRFPRRCRTRTMTRKAACPCRARISRPDGPTGRGSPASDADGSPVTPGRHRLVCPDAPARDRAPRRIPLHRPARGPAMRGRPRRPSSATAGVYPVCPGCLARFPTRSATRCRHCPHSGSRVSLRYRLPAGSAKPLTDVIGHLERLDPTVLIRTKDGELVDVLPCRHRQRPGVVARTGAGLRNPRARTRGGAGLARRRAAMAGRLAAACRARRHQPGQFGDPAGRVGTDRRSVRGA